MRRPILALLAACAVACTPMRDQAPAYAVSIFPAAESTRSPANGPDWKSDECDCLVTFSGVPNDVSAIKLPINLSYDHRMIYSEHSAEDNHEKYREYAECSCLKNGIPSNITRHQSDEAIGNLLGIANYNLGKTSFVKVSQLGKFAEFEATSPSVVGDLIVRKKIYYGKQCIFEVEAGAPRAEDDSPRAIAFLNSVRNPNSFKSPPLANPPQANDAASRLKALKDLLDQKLITPAQYEAKRQTIVDGM